MSSIIIFLGAVYHHQNFLGYIYIYILNYIVFKLTYECDITCTCKIVKKHLVGFK